jgi:hypothetical protein
VQEFVGELDRVREGVGAAGDVDVEDVFGAVVGWGEQGDVVNSAIMSAAGRLDGGAGTEGDAKRWAAASADEAKMIAAQLMRSDERWRPWTGPDWQLERCRS